jgi:hypothetical protein
MSRRSDVGVGESVWDGWQEQHVISAAFLFAPYLVFGCFPDVSALVLFESCT